MYIRDLQEDDFEIALKVKIKCVSPCIYEESDSCSLEFPILYLSWNETNLQLTFHEAVICSLLTPQTLLLIM